MRNKGNRGYHYYRRIPQRNVEAGAAERQDGSLFHFAELQNRPLFLENIRIQPNEILFVKECVCYARF